MIWQGVDREGVKIIIDEYAWKRHVMKHPEIEPLLEAVAKTMCNPEKIYPDTRPDEPKIYNTIQWRNRWLLLKQLVSTANF